MMTVFINVDFIIDDDHFVLGEVLHNFILYINDFLTFWDDNNSRVTTEDVRINDR